MKSERSKKLLCVLCLGLPVVWAAAAAAAAPSDMGSVMNRVQREEDPELGDLIRLALENRKVKREEAFEIVRKVTQSYAQIKLLDQQVAEVSRKAEAARQAEMRGELQLAKAELESKRITEVANLREMVGILPQLPLAEQQIEALKGQVSVQLIGERVYVLEGQPEGQPPFPEWWALQRWKLVGFLPEKETLEYVRKRLQDKESLPMLFHMYYDSDTEGPTRALRNKMIAVAKETRSQMETEMRLERINNTGSGKSTFYLRGGKITTFYTHEMARPDGGPEPLATGLVNPKDLEQHILWRLTKPKNVPLTFRVEYDQASAALAKQVADTARAVVKRLGIGELAPVEEVLVEPVPEKAFLGRWVGETRADIQAIEVRPAGVCQVTMGDRFGRDTTPGATKAYSSVSGTWLLTTNEIMIDIKDKSEWGPNHIYRGYLDEEGNLIVDRGVIYPQGSWHDAGGPLMVLKKVQ
jgi:hypothetical protein